MIKLHKADDKDVWLIEDTCLDIIIQSDVGGTQEDAINSFADCLKAYLLTCLDADELDRVLNEQNE